MKAISTLHTAQTRRLPLWSWLLLGGVTVGSLDLAFATGFWALRDGVAAVRIPQSIAAWVLGRDHAFAGGWTTALLGAALYFYLTTAMVVGYHLLARRYPALLRRPLLAGGLYGAAMYALLFELAVPLWSATGAGTSPLDWTLACLLAYVVLIGIPCALLARR